MRSFTKKNVPYTRELYYLIYDGKITIDHDLHLDIDLGQDLNLIEDKRQRFRTSIEIELVKSLSDQDKERIKNLRKLRAIIHKNKFVKAHRLLVTLLGGESDSRKKKELINSFKTIKTLKSDDISVKGFHEHIKAGMFKELQLQNGGELKNLLEDKNPDYPKFRISHIVKQLKNDFFIGDSNPPEEGFDQVINNIGLLMALKTLYDQCLLRSMYENLYGFRMDDGRIVIRNYIFNSLTIRPHPLQRKADELDAAFVKRRYKSLKKGASQPVLSDKYVLNGGFNLISSTELTENELEALKKQDAIGLELISHILLSPKAGSKTKWLRHNMVESDEVAGCILIPFDSAEKMIGQFFNENLPDTSFDAKKNLVWSNTPVSSEDRLDSSWTDDNDIYPLTPDLRNRNFQSSNVLNFIIDHFEAHSSSGYNKAKLPLIRSHGLYCAFCETPLNDGRNGDIEHKLPKSIFPTEALLWENFVHACKVCNSDNKESQISVSKYKNKQEVGNDEILELGIDSGHISWKSNEYKNPVELNELWKWFYTFQRGSEFLPKNKGDVNKDFDTVENRASYKKLLKHFEGLPDIDSASNKYFKKEALVACKQGSAKAKTDITPLIETMKAKAAKKQDNLQVKDVKSLKDIVDNVNKVWGDLLHTSGFRDYVKYKSNSHDTVCWPDKANNNQISFKGWDLRGVNSGGDEKTIQDLIDIDKISIGSKIDVMYQDRRPTVTYLNTEYLLMVNPTNSAINKQISSICGLNRTSFSESQAYWNDQRIVRRTKAGIHALLQFKLNSEYMSSTADLKAYYEVQLDPDEITGKGKHGKPKGMMIHDLNQSDIDGMLKWNSNLNDLMDQLSKIDEIMRAYLWQNTLNMVKDGGFYSTWIKTFEDQSKVNKMSVAGEERTSGLDINLVKDLEIESQGNPEDPFQFHGTDAFEIIKTLKKPA